MLDLLHAIRRNRSFARRRTLSLLDKAVEHHDPPAYQRTKEHPGDAFGTLETQLKETFSESLRMRLPQIGTEGDHSSREHDVACSERVRKFENLFLHRIAVVLDRVVDGS